jgi:hypothetical protein
MLIALSFWLLTALCCGYAAMAGGRDGRRVALAYIVGCLATLLAWFVQRDWTHTHYATFLVDALLLPIFWSIALRSDRWFPIWITGFHLVSVVSHVASLLVSHYAFKLYFFLQSFWSVPMLVILTIGVAIDRRQGLVDVVLPASRRNAG